MIKPFFTVLMLGLLGGCSSLAPSGDVSQGSKLVAPAVPPHWTMSGRIGVLKGDDGWHGKLDWSQDRDDFSIRILGPFGGEQAELRSVASQVELRAPGGQVVSGPRLAMWEREMFGVTLPVKALPYWLHASPYPGDEEKVTLDGKGQVKEIRQSGWRVDYSEWRKLGGSNLPGKINLTKNKVRIKLIVNDYSRRS